MNVFILKNRELPYAKNKMMRFFFKLLKGFIAHNMLLDTI